MQIHTPLLVFGTLALKMDPLESTVIFEVRISNFTSGQPTLGRS